MDDVLYDQYFVIMTRTDSANALIVALTPGTSHQIWMEYLIHAVGISRAQIFTISTRSTSTREWWTLMLSITQASRWHHAMETPYL